MRKYTRKERRRRKRLGYLPLSAGEQVLYITIYSVKDKLSRLSSRFRLWLKPRKGCKHCCVVCECYDTCRAELEADNDK